MELADLSSLRDVRELAGRLSRLDRLDVLINNAGLVLARRQVSADGFEYTFALNHLAPFLLSAAQGADTVVYLASSPDVAGATGGYYIKRRLRAPSGAARDPATARRLWAISAELTGLAEPGQPG